jgi:hypothetical protein
VFLFNTLSTKAVDIGNGFVMNHHGIGFSSEYLGSTNKKINDLV